MEIPKQNYQEISQLITTDGHEEKIEMETSPLQIMGYETLKFNFIKILKTQKFDQKIIDRIVNNPLLIDLCSKNSLANNVPPFPLETEISLH